MKEQYPSIFGRKQKANRRFEVLFGKSSSWDFLAVLVPRLCQAWHVAAERVTALVADSIPPAWL